MKTSFFFFALTTMLSSFSFTQNYNSELLKSYSKVEIQSMDVETLQALEYGIENAIYFIAIPKEKQSNFLAIKNPNSSSKYTDLGLKIMNENQYFEIKETNQLMVVKSLFVLKNELINKHKN
jgi:hypothetical protein